MLNFFPLDWSTLTAGIPPQTNPFEYVEQAILSQNAIQVSKLTWAFLFICGITTAVMLFCITVSAILIVLGGPESRSKYLWLFRSIKIKDHRISVIAPNSLLWTAVYQVLAGGFSLIYLYTAYRELKRSPSERPGPFYPSSCFNFVFLFSYLGLWKAGWGYWCASVIIDHGDAQIIRPALMNILGLAWPLVPIAMSIFSTIKLQIAFVSFKEFELKLMDTLTRGVQGWSKTPKTVEIWSLSAQYDTCRKGQALLAQWISFTAISQALMALVLVLMYSRVVWSLDVKAKVGKSLKVNVKRSERGYLKGRRQFDGKKLKHLKRHNQITLLSCVCWAAALLSFYAAPRPAEQLFLKPGAQAAINMLPLVLIFLVETTQCLTTLNRARNGHKKLKPSNQLDLKESGDLLTVLPRARTKERGLLSLVASSFQSSGTMWGGSSFVSSQHSRNLSVQPLKLDLRECWKVEQFEAKSADIERAERLL